MRSFEIDQYRSTEEEWNKTGLNIRGYSFSDYCWGQGKVGGCICRQRPEVFCSNTSYLYIVQSTKKHEWRPVTFYPMETGYHERMIHGFYAKKACT